MSTAKDVAEWLLGEVLSAGELYQDDAVGQIADSFGAEFVYENENGNSAISREVLRMFRALSGDRIVWVRSDRCWRLRESGDEPGRMQP